MLNQPCHVLPGIGENLSKRLGKCGLECVFDLILHLPFRYQDCTHVTPICDLRAQDWAVVVGEIVHVQIKRGKRPILECVIQDKTGQLRLKFFHFFANQVEQLKIGQTIKAVGEVKVALSYLEIIHPEYQVAQESPIQIEETLTPLYPSTEGLTQQRIRSIVKKAFHFATQTLAEFEWMDKRLLERFALDHFEKAVHYLHFPPPDLALSSLEKRNHPALKRLIFEELLAERISLMFAKKYYQSEPAPICTLDQTLMTQFMQTLPFELTNAQKKVFTEIADDLAQSKPMMRLVQGDVGSGKTIVAAMSALQVVKKGYQAVLMAPTELLSEQHTQNIIRWFEPFNVNICALTGKIPAKKRREILQQLADGTCHVLIGTHAVFQEQVQFSRLGLVVIDEQHRFGVAQRLALVQKGMSKGSVHQLLMTATPIPRTLKMSQCFLDISVIDELPPLRKPVTTSVMPQHKRKEILERLKSLIVQGRQAYWVCPLVEVSEKLQCQAAVETAEQLQNDLRDLKIGLVHGKMSSIEKDRIMLSFKNGELDLLVATTVIEVGVDVPNASLMIIENAERLGLSQLHQLRGRVGRGIFESYCLLLYQMPLSKEGIERLKIIRDTQDGFLIAEHDLKIRGAGELLGTKQTGYKHYKIVDIAQDHVYLPEIAKLSDWLIKNNPDLAKTIAKRWKGEVSQFLKG